MSKPPFTQRKYKRSSNSSTEADLTRDALQNYLSLRPKHPKKPAWRGVYPRFKK
jgi:hypothetical protein